MCFSGTDCHRVTHLLTLQWFNQLFVYFLFFMQKSSALSRYSYCDLCSWSERLALSATRGAKCCVTCKPAVEKKQPLLNQNKSSNSFLHWSPPLTGLDKELWCFVHTTQTSLSQTHGPQIFSWDIPQTSWGNDNTLFLAGCKTAHLQRRWMNSNLTF